jgi:hypothetical protein
MPEMRTVQPVGTVHPRRDVDSTRDTHDRDLDASDADHAAHTRARRAPVPDHGCADNDAAGEHARREQPARERRACAARRDGTTAAAVAEPLPGGRGGRGDGGGVQYGGRPVTGTRRLYNYVCEQSKFSSFSVGLRVRGVATLCCSHFTEHIQSKTHAAQMCTWSHSHAWWGHA